jgi:glutamate/tyrosine decarboxylase-like PLP-dependent enzyme
MPESPFGDETGIARMVGDWAADRVVRPADPKSSARTPEELHRDAGVTITRYGIGAEAALRVFDTVLVPATRAQDDPMNLAYIPSAPTRAAVAFDLATSAANVFGGIWEAGAGAIFAENEALAWIRGLLDWPSTAGGTFVSGGTSGNLSALHAARATARTRRGGRPEKGWAIACAASAHSSIRSAGSVLDVDVIPVQQDENGRLTGAALRPVLEAHPEICAVVASAGTTNTGTVDELDTVADVCQEFGVWLHVDGAYGGAALAAPTARALFRGIERADSFIVDPHKWLFAPYDCCALLYRDPELARAAHSQHASYLDGIDREATNPSDLAIQLSRRARGLPLWFSLATHGTAAYSAAVERSLTTAREVAAYIRASAHLTLLLEPMLSVVIFSRPGWSEEQYTAWSKHMAITGQVLCLPTRFQDEMVLRLAFVNPLTESAQVVEVLETLR